MRRGGGTQATSEARVKEIAVHARALQRCQALRRACDTVKRVGCVCAVLGFFVAALVTAAVLVPMAMAAVLGLAAARVGAAKERALLAAPYSTVAEIGALLESPAWQNSDGLRLQLAQLLAELSPEEADRLTRRQVESLHRCLREHGQGDGRLRRSALRLLGRIGGPATVAVIDDLLEAERNFDVVEAAHVSRQAIKQRMAAGSDSLLRPTDAPGEALLRPAEAGADEETLLRPANSDE